MVETEPQSYVLGSYGTAIINLKNGGENWLKYHIYTRHNITHGNRGFDPAWPLSWLDTGTKWWGQYIMLENTEVK
jgi:hypothetical protein